MRNVLITGATGFIGSYLVRRMIGKSYHLRILALPKDKKAIEYEKSGLEVVYGNITDSAIVDRSLKGIHIVYHLAAVVSDWAPEKLYREVNVAAMKNMCESSLKNKVERFVYISTNDVFGFKEKAIIDESFPYRPWHEPYPDSKLEASNIAWSYYRKGLPVSMIYPCWVYGPNDTTFLLPLVEAVRKGQLIYWRKNSLVWPAYIENVIDLLIEIGTNPEAIGQGFLIHDGVPDTLENFVSKIAEPLQLKNQRRYMPYFVAFLIGWFMQNVWKILGIKSRPLLTTYIVKNLGSGWRFSIAKAKRLLNWTPRISYDEGLSKTIEWLKSVKSI